MGTFFYMGGFGADSPKPTHVYGTFPGIFVMKMKDQGAATKRLSNKTESGKWNGNHYDLDASSAYPPNFCKLAACSILRTW